MNNHSRILPKSPILSLPCLWYLCHECLTPRVQNTRLIKSNMQSLAPYLYQQRTVVDALPVCWYLYPSGSVTFNLHTCFHRTTLPPLPRTEVEQLATIMLRISRA
ncbi:hypothetical protein HZ326_16967 [Fusarium oxysporum f. sp. albedinis]|nr:hypothetical protein HZ326_16967 [Fusarium oxysporum f. sp. albedinis]